MKLIKKYEVNHSTKTIVVARSISSETVSARREKLKKIVDTNRSTSSRKERFKKTVDINRSASSRREKFKKTVDTSRSLLLSSVKKDKNKLKKI